MTYYFFSLSLSLTFSFEFDLLFFLSYYRMASSVPLPGIEASFSNLLRSIFSISISIESLHAFTTGPSSESCDDPFFLRQHAPH